VITQRRGSARFGGIVKFAVGVVAGAGLSCALASAAQVVRHDGAFWKALGNRDKAAYIDGYSDAAGVSLGKLDQLKVAASLFHWKGANKILDQLGRGLDLSALSSSDLSAYLDNVYSNPQYRDFDVANAIELGVMRDLDGKSPAKATAPSAPAPPAASAVSDKP
jgi:hypothetical protein